MFTNRDALPFELAAVVDATAGRYRPPHPTRQPEAFHAYRTAWNEQADRLLMDPTHAAGIILGALLLRRAA